MSAVCRTPIPISELLCCLADAVCDDGDSQLTLDDIANGPGLTAWEDAQRCGTVPAPGTYSAAESVVLASLQAHLEDAWREFYDLDPAHRYRGQCCFRLFPCTPCGFCGLCRDCRESQVVAFSTPICGTIEWSQVISAEMVIGSVAEPVQLGWDGVAPGPTPARWRLETWPVPRLLRQALSGSSLPDIPTQELDQPPGSDDTWHLKVCAESDPPGWYVEAVADLACVRAKRCMPKAKCDIAEGTTRISNDAETIEFESVDITSLQAGASGTSVRSIDAAIQRLKESFGRRSSIIDPATPRPVIRVDVDTFEGCGCSGC